MRDGMIMDQALGHCRSKRNHVMPGLDPGIQFLTGRRKDWIAGSKPAPDLIRGPAMTVGWLHVRAGRIPGLTGQQWVKPGNDGGEIDST